MFKNYLVSALRNFWKNKLFAFINIIGLAIGLMVFVFANLFADYEESHDAFFLNSERIYSVNSVINPAARLGVVSLNTAYPAFGPLLRQDIPEIEEVARLSWNDIIVNREEVKFYQPVHFVDPEFLNIFHFDFLHGTEANALRDNNSIVLTEKAAIKYFGRTNVLGEVITLNNEIDLKVTGVIRDLPRNSHLSGNALDDERFEMLTTLAVNQDIFDLTDAEMNNWNNLSISNRTYVLLPEGVSGASLGGKLNAVMERYGPEDRGEIVSSTRLKPLTDMNLMLWDIIGIPGIFIMRFLGFLVLTIAAINFINLATAQAFGRAREIGIRKTMGASRSRLAIQFLVEAVVLTFFALLFAIAIIEYSLPAFNSATNKAMEFSYFSDFSMILFLLATVLGVGLISGSFPAFLLSKLEASKALKGSMALGKWSIRFRKFLVVSQNTFSVFLIIMVLVTYSMSNAIQNKDLGFNADNIEMFLRVNRAGVNENYETLKAEMERVPGVVAVTGSSQYPYEQSNSSSKYSLARGDEAGAISIQNIGVDYNFLEFLDIPLIAGRQLSRDYANDTIPRGANEDDGGNVNIIVNRMAAKQLGWANPAEAIGQTIYRQRDSGQSYSYTIVGVSENALFQGFHNEQKPFVHMAAPENFWALLVKYDPRAKNQAIQGVEAVWNSIVPDFPIIRLSTGQAFDDVFGLFKNINNALFGFTLMALLIATIGLFALSAFMAERRVKEVGIRKTLGASTAKIVKLLTYQFSIPVIWAVVLGSALGILATFALSQNFGGGTSNFSGLLILIPVGGVMSLVLAWITVGANAYRAAITNPAETLGYE